MKANYFVLSACLFGCAATSFAQVSNNNEDEVYRVDKRYSMNSFKPNEVIVKFKESSPVKTVRRSGARGMTTQVNNVDNVLNAIGVKEAEQLMPLTGGQVESMPRRAPGKGSMIKDMDLSQLYVLKYDNDTLDVLRAVEQLKALDDVEFAEPNYIAYICASGEGDSYSDPLMEQQWALDVVKLPQLWTLPKVTDRRPVIAILDTGVDINHPDLVANIWTNEYEENGSEFEDDDQNGYYDDLHGWDFVNNTAIIKNGMDGNGHGTHCAGIAAAVGNNGIGVVGANPDALILPIKVMCDDGSGDFATIIRGIDYAIAVKADILSMSFGSSGNSQSFENALRKAYAKYMVSVAAAGNNGRSIYDRLDPFSSGLSFPAAYDFVIGVQASDINASRFLFSNYDPDGHFYSLDEEYWNYEVMAPGVDVMSTFPDGKYKSLNGTSMSTPLVAGAISRLLQVKGFDYAKDYGLYGDIAESKDTNGVFDAYQLSKWTEANRSVALRILSVRIDDTQYGNGDGIIDAGETVAIYPTIRSLWGNAKNIKVKCFVNKNSEYAVDFVESDVNFGVDLNSQGSAESKKPLIVKVKEGVNDGFNLLLSLVLTCDNMSEEERLKEQQVTFTVANGVRLGGIISSDLVLTPDVHYVVTSDLAIPSGVTVTILPGTTLKFRGERTIRCEGNFICSGTKDNFIKFTNEESAESSGLFLYLAEDGLNYVKMTNLFMGIYSCPKGLNDCVITDCKLYSLLVGNIEYGLRGMISHSSIINNFSNCTPVVKQFLDGAVYSNFIGNTTVLLKPDISGVSQVSNGHVADNIYENLNIFNNNDGGAIINYGCYSSSIETRKLNPIYWGTNDEDKILEGIRTSSFCYADISDRLTEPSSLAPGIVWKVLVNGTDAQDEFEDLPPLGVGTHRFDVYFNRAMNKNVAPVITMGLREPYTQTVIAKNGKWNAAGTVYTAYLTITGKDNMDGLNRIRVEGALDDEYFQIPVEESRFNVMVQKAGSMSTGLMAEAGLGNVKLTWETDEADFADLMGYNVYRTQENSNDTIMINTTLIEANETEYTDFNVVPGTTYYYMVKEMGTDLVQHEISNIVAATPLTASKGDANGSMSVDIADVVTEIAYLTNQNPQPFIFEAADVNEDNMVNILDVVGTINIIMAPATAAISSIDETAAKYSVEDGVLYVETPVTLGGLQVLVNANKAEAEFSVMDGLAGFEQTSCWTDDNTYMLLAYSMSGKTLAPGKHALLRIGEGNSVKQVVLSDYRGQNVVAVEGNANAIRTVDFYADSKVSVVITDLTGATIAAYNTTLDNAQKAWKPATTCADGFYMKSIYANGILVNTEKVFYQK